MTQSGHPDVGGTKVTAFDDDDKKGLEGER